MPALRPAIEHQYRDVIKYTNTSEQFVLYGAHNTTQTALLVNPPLHAMPKIIEIV